MNRAQKSIGQGAGGIQRGQIYIWTEFDNATLDRHIDKYTASTMVSWYAAFMDLKTAFESISKARL